MKKIICILLAMFSIATLFFGCAKNDTKTNTTNNDVFENYSNADNNTEQETIYIDSGVVGFDNMNFEYNGTPIEFDYKYNSSADCEMGLQLFVNGILQEFTVNNEVFNLYKVNCKANRDEIFRVSFTPNNGIKGETSSLIFANIYNPEIIEFEGTVNTFGNNHKISQPMPWGINMNVDIDEKSFDISNEYIEHKFTQEELGTFIRTLNDGTKISKLDDHMKFDIDKDIEKISLGEEIVFDLYGNFEGKYRISLYGDFEKISINGSDYIDINVEKNTKHSVTVNTENFKSYKNIYAVAVSLDNSEGLIKSSSYFIENNL